MHKQFLLLFIIIFNVSINSQVVIKDEIILYETENPDEENLTIPFYGKVKETLYSAYPLICSKARNELIVGGTFYQFGPCWGWDCGISGSCFCSSNISQLIENIPMGSEINIRIQKCSNWEGGSNYYWKVLEHYFEIYSSTTEYKKYKIYSRYDESSQWEDVGWLEFGKTTPPGCDPQFDCAEENFLPEVAMNIVPDGYNGFEICSDIPDPLGKVGVTKIFWEDTTYIFQFNSCYNKQLQRWWFNLNNNHSFLINYRSQICTENVPNNRELIYDWQGFPLDYGCDKIIDDLLSHYVYGATQLGAYYMLEVIISAHEQVHKNDYEYFMNKNKLAFYNKLLGDKKSCEDFNSLEDAQNYWNSKLELEFASFKSSFKAEFSDYRKSFGTNEFVDPYEEATNNNLLVQGAIIDQINFVKIFFGCQD